MAENREWVNTAPGEGFWADPDDGDGQQEIPVPGPLALRPGDAVERMATPGMVSLSPFSITMPADVGMVIDVVTGEAGRVQQVFLSVEGTPGLVMEFHVTGEVGGVTNRWRKAADR